MADFQPKDAVVWFEIPVTDMAKSKAFYAAVLQNQLDEQEGGPNPMASFAVKDMQSGVSGHLYPGKPAASGTGPTIHLAIPDSVEEAMKRVTANGGQVVSPVITIPQGRFCYCVDPDGNSIGLFK